MAGTTLFIFPWKGSYEEIPVVERKGPSIARSRRYIQDLADPTDLENGTGGVEWDGERPQYQAYFTNASAGYDLVKTLQLKMVQGRGFFEGFSTDSVVIC